jgi:phosphoglycolate phosphatase
MSTSFPESFSAVIFDLDGTLLDTLEDLANTLNSVLENNGYPTHSLEKCRMLVGFGMRQLVRSALPEALHENETLVDALLKEMHELYASNWNIHSRPYGGIGELLDSIDRMGLKKAILSNKPDRFTQLCADELLSPWTFEVVMGHHDGIAHKPDPQGALLIADMLGEKPSSILYIGDSGIDMQTATAAGMYPLGVTWGFRPAAELIGSGAETVVTSTEQIIKLLLHEPES